MRAQRVAGRGVLETRERDDVARERLLDVLAIVGMHQQHAADLFLLVLDGVEDLRGGLHLARIDAGEGERADERIVHDLEGERGHRGIVRRRTLFDRHAVELEAFDGRNVERRRQIVDDAVEQRLDALVLERRTAQHGDEREVERALADQRLELRDGGLGALQIRLHQVVVLLDRHLDQLGACDRRGIRQVVGDRLIFELGAEALLEPDDRAVLDEIDEALEAALDADRQIQHRRTRAEAILDHLHAALEARAGAVELVDEAHARDVILLGLAPHRLGLRLDAGNAVEARDRAVEHAQRTLDFDREVDVAGRVDDVDAVIVPEARRGSRRDRDPALLLLLHPVHRRGALMDLADLVGLAGVVEDTLGRRRLAGIDVRHDADVAILLERMAAGHDLKLRCRAWRRSAKNPFGLNAVEGYAPTIAAPSTALRANGLWWDGTLKRRPTI